MTSRSARVFLLGITVLSISAFGQIIDPNEPDPVGFCPPPASVPACTTGTGFGGETIPVGTTSFGMEKNGSGMSTTPWYLLLSVPETVHNTAVAPVLTSVGGVFTQVGATAGGTFLLRTTSGGTSIYNLEGVVGDSSMNAPNMFCDGSAGFPNKLCTKSNEISAFGS